MKREHASCAPPKARLCLWLAGTALACAVPAVWGSQLGISFETTEAAGTLGSGMTQGGMPVSGTATLIPNSGGSQIYGNSFTAPTSEVGTSGYGFFDDYAFTIATSSFDSVTTTISLGSQFQISNLAVRLFSTSSYDLFAHGGVPSYAPISGEIDATESGSTETISAVDLSAGTYVLEIRGTATGTGGGSYSGVLNVSPVPLPGSVWLALSGLAALVPLLRIRRFA